MDRDVNDEADTFKWAAIAVVYIYMCMYIYSLRHREPPTSFQRQPLLEYMSYTHICDPSSLL